MPHVLLSNCNLQRLIYARVVTVHLQQSAERNPNYDAVTCGQPLVSAAISGKLASGLSTASMTVLHYLRLNRDQRYIYRKPKIAVTTLALHQQRTTGEQPTMPRPQCLCTNLDSRHPGSVHHPYGSGGVVLARAGLAAPAMTQTCQQSLQRYINRSYDNHVRNTFVCRVIRHFISTEVQECNRRSLVSAIGGGGTISGISIIINPPRARDQLTSTVTITQPCSP